MLTFYREFKEFVVSFYYLIELDLDKSTRDHIDQVFTLENSGAFLLSKFVCENIDNFFRFAYILVFLIFFCFKMATLYGLPWLQAASSVLFALSVVLWMVFQIAAKMRKEEWKFGYTLSYYAKMNCIVPQRKQFVLKFQQVKQEQRRNESLR